MANKQTADQYLYQDGKWIKAGKQLAIISGDSPTPSIDTLITKITWAELKEKRDNAELIPGMKYQITDYECTTIQQNTASAGHQFDIIVEALSENKLSEDAKATMHEGDTYFQIPVQHIKSASWIQPLPDPSEIEFFYDLSDNDAMYGASDPEDTNTVISELGTKTNADGVEVPAMLNPDPDDQGNDVWYLYNGTYQITEWKNTLVNALYSMRDGSDPEYGKGQWHKEDLIVDLDVVQLKEKTALRLYKTDIKNYSIDDVDYKDWYEYEDDYVLDGVTYNRWAKYEEGNRIDLWVLTNVIVVNNQFTITQDQLKAAVQQITTVYDKWTEESSPYSHLTLKLVNAEIEQTLVPVANMNAWQLKYCLDNDTSKFYWASDKEGAWYGQVFLYTQSIEIDGTTYYQFDREDYDNSIYSIKRYPMKNDSVYVLKDGKMVADDTFDKDYVYQGKGVIYQMIDEWQNEAPYDFKNILISDNLYTFSQGAFGSYTDASIGKICKSNKIEATNSISRKGSRNAPNYIGLNYFVNRDGYIVHNYIGLNSYKNVIGSIEEYNGVLSSNYIGDGCHSNTVTGSYNKINNGGVSNAITGEYNIISFNGSNIGITGSYNTFGSSCDNVAISNGSYNVIDDNCSYLWINATDDTWFTNVHVHSGIQGSKNQRRWINTDDATGSSSKSIDVYASNSVSIVLEDTY